MMEERIEKALGIIHQFGGIDGAHHKQWVLDQVVRALTGCPMVLRAAASYRGIWPDVTSEAYTFETQGESAAYLEWVRAHKDGEDGPETYEWEEGIAP
jgi:hypothetical protein